MSHFAIFAAFVLTLLHVSGGLCYNFT